jgi:hypothetical protein
VFERLSKERSLPSNIRSDNGVPFASGQALFNLSKLAVWWLRLGIGIERIKPGHPQQNGRHERMHLTKPPAGNFLQRQARFDDTYKGLPDIDYPFHDKIIVVTNCGRICLGRKKINFSTVFAGQAVGIEEVHDDIWLVSSMDYDWDTSILILGYSSRWKTRSAQECYLCSRYVVLPMSPGRTQEKVARPGGLELPTFWFVARRSIQLSYGRADTLFTFNSLAQFLARFQPRVSAHSEHL